MAAFDLVIEDATLVADGGPHPGWLGIADGRFAVVESGAPPSSIRAAERHHALGLLALPGLVDCHTHLREPGLEHKEDFTSGTAAAAAGGVTTLLVMPFCRPAISSAALLVARRAIAESKALVDFGLQAVIGPANLGEAHALRDAGAVSFEVLLADGPDGLTTADDAALLASLEAIANVGGLAGVYCESESLKNALTARLQAQGRTDPSAHALSRPTAGEAAGVARAALIARHTGADVHLRQLSTRESVALVRALKSLGIQLTAEVNPHHLFLTSEELSRQGPFARVNPPLRPEADVEALWEGLRDGTLDLIGTDHAPHTAQEKEAGRQDIWSAPPGLPGLESWLPLMLEAVAAGRMDLRQLARWCAEVPAERFGLGRRKGKLAVGYDADLVLVDPETETRLVGERLHTKAAYTPFQNLRLRGAIRSTYLRGRRILHDGLLDLQPRGQFLQSETS